MHNGHDLCERFRPPPHRHLVSPLHRAGDRVRLLVHGPPVPDHPRQAVAGSDTFLTKDPTYQRVLRHRERRNGNSQHLDIHGGSLFLSSLPIADEGIPEAARDAVVVLRMHRQR